MPRGEFALLTILLGAAGCSAPESADAVCRDCPQVGLKTSIDICPIILSFGVEPFETAVGSSVDLFAETDDPDSDHLSFSWSASIGDVSDPKAERTTYVCSAEGIATLTFTVADDQCSDSDTAVVVCCPAGEACGRDR